MQFHCHQHKVTSDELRDLICPDCDNGLDSDNSGVDPTIDYETFISQHKDFLYDSGSEEEKLVGEGQQKICLQKNTWICCRQ